MLKTYREIYKSQTKQAQPAKTAMAINALKSALDRIQNDYAPSIRKGQNDYLKTLKGLYSDLGKYRADIDAIDRTAAAQMNSVLNRASAVSAQANQSDVNYESLTMAIGLLIAALQNLLRLIG